MMCRATQSTLPGAVLMHSCIDARVRDCRHPCDHRSSLKSTTTLMQEQGETSRQDILISRREAFPQVATVFRHYSTCTPPYTPPLQACCLHWTRQRLMTFPATSSVFPSPSRASTSNCTEEKVESNIWHLTMAGAVGGVAVTRTSASSTAKRACMICLPPGCMGPRSIHSSIRRSALYVAGGSDLTPP